MKCRFWGTRGSVPVSGPQYLEFGGNTPCLQLTTDGCPDPIVLDSGTGIREFGQHFMARRSEYGDTIHLFLTHAHWDHIQGFPFFIPAYVPGIQLHIYCTKKAKEFLSGQMTAPYFPVGLDVMMASFHFHELNEGVDMRLGDVRVQWIPLPHPQESTGFRIDDGSRSLVFATDTEHPREGLNEELVGLARKTDVLVYDAQYTPDEYEAGKQGWGHSTFHEAAMIAKASHTDRLVLFSHDPSHDDAACRAIETACQEEFPNTWSARQGIQIDI